MTNKAEALAVAFDQAEDVGAFDEALRLRVADNLDRLRVTCLVPGVDGRGRHARRRLKATDPLTGGRLAQIDLDYAQGVAVRIGQCGYTTHRFDTLDEAVTFVRTTLAEGGWVVGVLS